MNKLVIVGNLARDPEYQILQSGTAMAKFTVASNRRGKGMDGKPEADFIPCVAWNKTAEFVSKHFHKGSGIVIDGSLRVRPYEKDGQKRIAYECVCENVDFCGPKRRDDDSGGHSGGWSSGQSGRYMQQTDLDDEMPDNSPLPF